MSLISGSFSTFLGDFKHIIFSCFLASFSPPPLSIHSTGFFCCLVGFVCLVWVFLPCQLVCKLLHEHLIVITHTLTIMAQKGIYTSLVKAYSFLFTVHHCRWNKKDTSGCQMWSSRKQLLKVSSVALLVGLLRERGTTKKRKEIHR